VELSAAGRKDQGAVRLTNLGRLAAGQLGEELRILVPFVPRPGGIGAHGILEGILWMVSISFWFSN
jgi:hypothetical protein